MSIRSRKWICILLSAFVFLFILAVFFYASKASSKTDAKSKAELESEDGLKSKAELMSEDGPKSKAEPASEDGPKSNIEPASEAESESEIESESESEFQTELTPAELQAASELSEPGEELIDVESQTGSILLEPENDLIGVESAEVVTDTELETLISQIRSALPVGNGSWAVYISDLVKGTEATIDSRRMQAASLIKLYIMGAVYENYEKLVSQYGKDTLDYYLQAMITVSDNDSANALVSCLGDGDPSAGMSIVNDYCLAHGYYETHMGRLLLQSNEFDDNYTSVSDCGHFLINVYDGNTTENPYADSMYSLLKAQQRRNKIPAQMPEGVCIANKTGELDDVENDAGILYDTENDLVIVFMSENLSDVGSAQYTIASLSRQIYDYYCN